MKQLINFPSLFPSFLFLGLIFSTFQVKAQLTGDSFAEAKTNSTANVTFTYIETPGFTVSEGGRVTGFCVELMDEFAKWLKTEEGIVLKATFSDTEAEDFSLFMKEVKRSTGGVFGLGNITITEERKKTYHFSPAFISNVAILMTNKSVPNLNSLEEMDQGFGGMTMVTVKSTLNEERLMALADKYYPDVQIKYVPSNTEALEEIARNEMAFTDLDFTYYLAALKNRMPVKRHPVGDETSEEFGIIMPKSSDWAPVMARFMESGFMESTQYRKMIADHLGQHALKLLDAVSLN